MVVLAIIGSILLLLFILLIPLKFNKGKNGEKKVAKVLNKIVKHKGGYVINDIIIPEKDGDQTSQIDHIILTKYFVAVIETKNYSGRIYGNDSMLKWKQYIGNTVNEFYSPVKQNETHRYRLAKLLRAKVEQIIPVVVFIGADTSTIQSKYVYTLNNLYDKLMSIDKELYREDIVTNTYNLLMSYKLAPVESKIQHVRKIRKTQKNIEKGICPRCGGKLVERVNSQGQIFYGCSNYPKCKFTKKY